VPAGPLELERRRGDELLHRARTGGTDGQRGIRELPDDLETAALTALVLVEWHDASPPETERPFILPPRRRHDQDRARRRGWSSVDFGPAPPEPRVHHQWHVEREGALHHVAHQ